MRGRPTDSSSAPWFGCGASSRRPRESTVSRQHRVCNGGQHLRTNTARRRAGTRGSAMLTAGPSTPGTRSDFPRPQAILYDVAAGISLGRRAYGAQREKGVGAGFGTELPKHRRGDRDRNVAPTGSHISVATGMSLRGDWIGGGEGYTAADKHCLSAADGTTEGLASRVGRLCRGACGCRPPEEPWSDREIAGRVGWLSSLPGDASRCPRLRASGDALSLRCSRRRGDRPQGRRRL